MFWKHIRHLLSKNIDFDILESWKIITDLQHSELLFCLKMAKTYRKNTYMGYGSCTAMIVACSILIIIISKPPYKTKKIPTYKSVNKNKASLKPFERICSGYQPGYGCSPYAEQKYRIRSKTCLTVGKKLMRKGAIFLLMIFTYLRCVYPMVIWPEFSTGHIETTIVRISHPTKITHDIFNPWYIRYKIFFKLNFDGCSNTYWKRRPEEP